MATRVSVRDRSVVVADTERRQADQVLHLLDGHLDRLTLSAQSSSSTSGIPQTSEQLPAELVRVLATVVEVMAHGGTVTIGSLPEELTTSVAAEQLGISRPTLMKLIKGGELAAHKVGSHHRVRLSELRAFQRQRLAAQQRAFADLRDLVEDLDARDS